MLDHSLRCQFSELNAYLRNIGQRPMPRSDFATMAFSVVFVGLAVFFIGYLFVGAVAEGLVLGQAAHADEYRTGLRFDFKWLFIVFDDFAHNQRDILTDTAASGRRVGRH